MIIRKLIILILLLGSHYINAQYALRAMQYRPTGNLGGIMKKGIGGELIYMKNHQEEEEEVRVRYGFGFVKLSPRLDTFPTISY